jgi:hypothetical protein
VTPATVAAKGGTIGREMAGKIWPESSVLTLLSGFFYMPQICDMGHDGFYFPNRKEGVLRIFFFALKKSDGFGRV